MTVETFEQCICDSIGCEHRTIPRDCVKSTIDRQTGKRTVRAYCEGCDRLWVCHFRLVGDQWIRIGDPYVDDSTARRSNFKAGIERVRGTAPATAPEHFVFS